MSTLAEKYRPQSLGELAGNAQVKARLARIMATPGGIGGKAIWLEGGTGTGKTTTAMILARSIADESFGTIQELDAGTLMPGTIRELEDTLALFAMGCSGLRGRVVIVNEAHGLRQDTLRQLLVTLERIPDHAAWIFTTTNEGVADLFAKSADAAPLRDRCLRFVLKADQTAFAERCRTIAATEGLDGSPLDAYRLALARANNSLRAVLMQVEAGEFIPE